MKNVWLYDQDALRLDFIEIYPGDHIVLKPNLVKEGREDKPEEWECVITSPWLIRQVCEYVCKKLQGKGLVTICDAPQSDSDFAKIRDRARLDETAADCSAKYGVRVEVIDLRSFAWSFSEGVVTDRHEQVGDSRGKIRFRLDGESKFAAHRGEGRYYGADYDSGSLNSHHSNGVHEYLVCATPIVADVFICMPKMKTHKKTGCTLSFKNLVGINADKNWLPHHTCGAPENGGDEFPQASAKNKGEGLARQFSRAVIEKLPVVGPWVGRFVHKVGKAILGSGKTTVRSGNWYGNDTTWRMVHDLNYCLRYGNPDGTFRKDNPKRYYTVLDGIVGMEGVGPMQGTAKPVGLVLGGDDPLAVDAVAARIMGFDWRKLKVMKEAVGNWKITTITSEDEIWSETIISNRSEWNGKSFRDFAGIYDGKPFEPHFGWKGHLEWDGLNI